MSALARIMFFARGRGAMCRPWLAAAPAAAARWNRRKSMAAAAVRGCEVGMAVRGGRVGRGIACGGEVWDGGEGVGAGVCLLLVAVDGEVEL